MNTIALGLYALWALALGSYDIAIGVGAGSTLISGSCDILVGDNVQPPTPETSFYINVDGVEYPNTIRSDPTFQAKVKRRAHDLIAAMSDHDLHGGTPRFIGDRAAADSAIDGMSFDIQECTFTTEGQATQ